MRGLAALARQVKAVDGIESSHLAEALFTVDLATGLVRYCNDNAATLLARPADEICGGAWGDVVDLAPAPRELLLRAARVEHRVTLPPFALRTADGERVVAGMLMPAGSAASDCVNLLLWPLLHDDHGLETGGADVIAIVGVDRLRYTAGEQAGRADVLMRDVIGSLSGIVRSQDSLALTSDSGCVLVMRDVDVQSATDICRALLSHLHRALEPVDGNTPAHRFCIGLAPTGKGRSAMAALVSASHALALVQRDRVAVEPIRVAAPEDGALLAGEALIAGGEYRSISQASGGASRDDAAAPEHEAAATSPPVISPIEKNIEGYVVDNMEGAVDQAVFLAKLDVPVGIIGPAGTGKMYVARVIHEESGGLPDQLVQLDCREFRSRGAAAKAIARELARTEGHTLVFKSPHLMHAEAQVKLARQIATRTRADVSPPQYLSRMKLVALFPEKLEALMRRGELAQPLASVFAGYPIHVPAIKDRKQAVLRWAHKILGQEGLVRDRDMKGFTPDAERAMLNYDWPGNISEMRQVISDALDKTDKDWLTPVDLGLFKGISPDGEPYLPEPKAFLSLGEEAGDEEVYEPSSLEAVEVALGEAVHNALALNLLKPLGTWLEDDMVLAALDRYRGDVPRAAAFLHTKPRNISRWLPKIEEREEARNTSTLWQRPRRLLWDWVRESGQMEQSPLERMQATLMAQVNEQAGGLSAAKRARIMGVSTPTFLKRMREGEYSS